MVQSADHLTALTSASPTVTISKNGGSFGSPSGAVTEIANGWYKVAGNATDTGTAGPIALHATATSGDPFDGIVAEVVAYDPQDSVRGGMTALPNAAAGASGGLPLSVDTSGRVDVLKINGTSQTARDLGASVLLSNGTGTGQISLSSGAVLLQATQTGVTIPTVTNLTNAPGAGDFTSTMKTSLNAATPASVQNIPVNADTYVNVHVKASDNIDFGALQKTSPNAATPASVQNISAQTGDSYARLGAPAGASISADIAANKTLLTNGTYGLSALETLIAALPSDATVQTDCYAALNTAVTDATSLNANSLLDRIRTYGWIVRNKIAVTDANGNTVIYKDDNATAAFTVAGMLTDDSTTTTRLRAA